jgi:predicted DNA-binding transcriptional regulator YafY
MGLDTAKSLIRLGIQFQKGQRFTLKAIKEQFNVSSRTAYRYIHTLRNDYDAPIIYDDLDSNYRCIDAWNFFEAAQKQK